MNMSMKPQCSLRAPAWMLHSLNLTVFAISILTLAIPRGIGFATFPMLLVCLLLLMVVKGDRQSFNTQEKLLLVGFLALPTAVMLSMALHGDWVLSHLDNSIRFLAAIPVFIAIRNHGFSRQYFYLGLMIGSIIAGCLGYYQKYMLGMPVASGFTYKIGFGDLSLMLGMLSMTYGIRPVAGQKVFKWMLVLAVIAFLFGLLGSLSSGTRGGWVGVPLLLWLLVSEIFKNKKSRWLIYGCCILSLVLIYLNNDFVKNKVNSAVVSSTLYFQTGHVKGTAGDRLEMWKAAGLMFQENPWIGVGKEGFGDNQLRLAKDGLVSLGLGENNHAHNELFNMLAELGALGGLAFLLVFGSAVIYFFSHRAVDRQASTAGLLLCFGYLDFGLTQALFEHNITTSFFAFYVAIIAGMLSKQAAKRPFAPSVP